MKEISPEEKLLRLIRGKKKQDIATDKKSADMVTPTQTKPASKLSIPALIQRYLYLFNVQKIIWLVFVVSCIYLAISLVYPWLGLRKIKLPLVIREKIIESKLEKRIEVKPYEFYQQGMGNKQIFGAISMPETQMPATGVNADLMKDINLVGIITGENPQAVIEDKKTQKTYYVTKGQFIGQLQVEDIQEGKIIINYKGQRFELYL